MCLVLIPQGQEGFQDPQVILLHILMIFNQKITEPSSTGIKGGYQMKLTAIFPDRPMG